LPLEVHQAVFDFVLRIAVEKKLVDGKTVVVDSTTLEANAAMKSIVRKDTGEDWNEYLRRLMQEQDLLTEGQEPTVEDLRRFDKQRKGKHVSNEEWESPTDPDSRIAQMKDGTTHLAYKAEHVVDEASDFLLAAEIHPANRADTVTLVDSVLEAQGALQDAGSDVEIREVVTDKGYHAAETLELCDAMNLRTYIPEPRRKHRLRWKGKPDGYQRCVYGNRRRMRGARGKALSRRRSELAERTFAHVCETGGARRSWLRGLVKVAKRYVIQAAARNLGLILRKLFGIGTARSLQGLRALLRLVHLAIACFLIALNASPRPWRQATSLSARCGT
jgi:hypothetical protein